MSYFDTKKKKLTPKQAQWQELLAEFDCTLKYKPGKTNVVADTRSKFLFQWFSLRHWYRLKAISSNRLGLKPRKMW